MFPIRPYPLLFAAAAALTLGSALSADEIQFANGDRLSGKILVESETSVTIANPVLGEIVLPKQEGMSLLRDPAAPAVAASTVAQDSPPVARERAKTDAPPRAAPGTKPDKPPHEKTKEPPGWKGKFEFGFNQQEGRRNVVSFELRASAERKIDDNSLTTSARLLYGKQEKKVNNDRYDGSFRWRRQLSERTFTQTLTSYYRDNLKDIHDNWEQNVGAGVRLLKNDSHVVNIGAGLTGQYREALVAESGFFALIELFQDYNYKINERISLVENAVAQYSPDSQSKFTSVSGPSTTAPGVANYKLKFNTALQGKVTNRVSVNLRFEYEFDNAVTPADARGDQRITSSVVYGF